MSRNRTDHPSRGTAVVIGGSMAGLSAAAVLATRFSSVVIVERDAIVDGPADRKGVPQGRHAHGLLPAGLERLERWFPGLSEELVGAGASCVDIGRDASWYQGGGYRARFSTGVSGPVASRALLEHHVRRRVLALANVTLRGGAGATGVTTDDDGSTVTGVILEDGATIDADLVVDASGRAARSLPWLRELGYELPHTSHISINVAYASRVLDVSTDPQWKLAVVLAGPPTGRQGVAFPLDGGRWMVTMAGVHGERPPSDDAGFRAFARSLPSPEIADLLDSATWLGPIATHRMPSNQRRHLERLRRVPGGLILLGDAVCSFNPSYGQGMSTATLQAEALGRTLDRVPGLGSRFVRAFYKAAAKAITPAWQMTTGADFALPATTGPKAPGTDLLNRLMPYVFRACQVDERVTLRVIEVTSLMRPPQTLLTPAMLVRVFRGAGRTPQTLEVPVRERQPVAA